MKKLTKFAGTMILIGSLTLLQGCPNPSGPSTPKHEHAWSDWSLKVAPTCETKGVETRVCGIDSSHIEERYTDAIGHDVDYVGGTQPTCLTPGEATTEICKRPGCDHSVLQDSVPALGHNWGAGWVQTTYADCENDGLQTRTCERDGTTETRDLPLAFGHAWGNWVGTATCETAGTETQTCDHDHNHKNTRPQAALGHYIDGNGNCPHEYCDDHDQRVWYLKSTPHGKLCNLGFLGNPGSCFNQVVLTIDGVVNSAANHCSGHFGYEDHTDAVRDAYYEALWNAWDSRDDKHSHPSSGPTMGNPGYEFYYEDQDGRYSSFIQQGKYPCFTPADHAAARAAANAKSIEQHGLPGIGL